MVKILIANDSVLIAQVLASELRSRGCEAEVVSAFEGALHRAKPGACDVILLSPHMSGMAGLHSVEQMCQRSGDAKVLLFSGEVSFDFVQKAMEVGAWGYVPKNISVSAFHGVLELVNNGQKFLPSDLREWAGSKGSDFTGRELIVLKAIAQGETNKDIARLIAVSEGNVKAIVRSICIRMGARNRAHAVKIALQSNLV